MTVAEPVGRRERGKAERRERILTAARTLLRTSGYDGMTMAQVAELADVGVGTVFQYAATKAELLMMATAERWSGLIPELVAQADGLDPAGAIHHLLTPFAHASLLDSSTAVAIAREVLFGQEGEHRATVLGMVDQVEEAIGTVISRTAPEQAPQAARLIVSGAIVELNRTRTEPSPPELAEARIDELVRIVLAGVTP